MKHWNGWLMQILKLSFALVGIYIFLKSGQFPILNDFFVKSPQEPYLVSVGKPEGLLFVFLASCSQIGFIIGIIFNLIVFSLYNKFGDNSEDYKIPFTFALITAIIFTLILVFGLPFVGSLLMN
jgi:hypothetical protein